MSDQQFSEQDPQYEDLDDNEENYNTPHESQKNEGELPQYQTNLGVCNKDHNELEESNHEEEGLKEHLKNDEQKQRTIGEQDHLKTIGEEDNVDVSNQAE